ncbi:MAG: hypothetical protein JNK85_20255 [Verrucomicrobiales bacterium]|nr:hypothetical protein [Verrucomicrobiales bacterium]
MSFAGGRYFALGMASYHDSVDARNWQFHEVLTPTGDGFPSMFSAVAFGNGRYVMVGGQTHASYSGMLLTTEDPDHPQWRPPEGWTDTAPLLAIERQNGLFVAVGGTIVTGTRIVTSTDGILWTDRSPNFQSSLLDVAYGAGRWVAVGGVQLFAPTAGILLSSSNAIDWIRHDIGTVFGSRNGGFILKGVTFGHGSFLATGVGDRSFPILTGSFSGTTWSTGAGEYGSSGWDVAFGDGLFVSGGHSQIASSVDGASLSWKPHASLDLRGNLVFANHTFLGINPGAGKIWQSGDVRPRIHSATQSNPGQMQLRIESVSDSPLTLDESSDLLHWNVRTQWVASGSTSEVKLSVAHPAASQFFRIRSP